MDLKIDESTLSKVVLLDTGANVNLIRAQLLPDHLQAKFKTNSNQTVKGITCTESIIGSFMCSIQANTVHMGNIPFLIVNHLNVDVIIGSPVLKHESVQVLSFDLKQSKMVVNRLIDGAQVIQDAPLVQYPRDEPTVQTVDTDESVPYAAKLKHVEHDLKVKLSHLDGTAKKSLVNLLYRYRVLFGQELGEFPYSAKIPTRGDPISKNQYPIAEAHIPLLNAEIEKMLKNGTIEKCSDPQGLKSPFVVVRKANGDIRPCSNFKGTLNKRLVNEETFAQAPIDELFNRLKPNTKYFAALDLVRGYHQIPLDQADRHKTAFQWRGQMYQYCKLPFGLRTAGSIFSRAIHEALAKADFDEEHTYCYLDDISAMAPTLPVFIRALEKVFIALKTYGLRVNPAKCSFLEPKIKFLGRVISENRIEPDPTYLEGVQKMKIPRTKKQHQSLVGCLNWLRNFIGGKMGQRI